MRTQKRKVVLFIWLCVVLSTFYIFLFERSWIDQALTFFLSNGTLLASITLLILGSLRGFTLLPVTLLLVAGILFVPAWPLFIIILIGIVISSLSVYYFSGYLKLDTLFDTKHRKLLEKGKQYLNNYEFPVVTLWSMMPFLPTDVICYLAGTIRMNVYKFILGVLIGEGIVCALYIWGGKSLLYSFGF